MDKKNNDADVFAKEPVLLKDKFGINSFNFVFDGEVEDDDEFIDDFDDDMDEDELL